MERKLCGSLYHDNWYDFEQSNCLPKGSDDAGILCWFACVINSNIYVHSFISQSLLSCTKNWGLQFKRALPERNSQSSMIHIHITWKRKADTEIERGRGRGRGRGRREELIRFAGSGFDFARRTNNNGEAMEGWRQGERRVNLGLYEGKIEISDLNFKDLMLLIGMLMSLVGIGP